MDLPDPCLGRLRGVLFVRSLEHGNRLSTQFLSLRGVLFVRSLERLVRCPNRRACLRGVLFVRSLDHQTLLNEKN